MNQSFDNKLRLGFIIEAQSRCFLRVTLGYDTHTTGMSIIANVIEKVQINGTDEYKLQMNECRRET